MKARNRSMRAFTASMWWLRGGASSSAVRRCARRAGCARPSRSARSPRGRPCRAPHRAPSPAAGRPRSPPGPRPRWRQTPGDRRDPLPREASSPGSASRPEAPWLTRRAAVGRPATPGGRRGVVRGVVRGIAPMPDPLARALAALALMHSVDFHDADEGSRGHCRVRASERQ